MRRFVTISRFVTINCCVALFWATSTNSRADEPVNHPVTISFCESSVTPIVYRYSNLFEDNPFAPQGLLPPIKSGGAILPAGAVWGNEQVGGPLLIDEWTARSRAIDIYMKQCECDECEPPPIVFWSYSLGVNY